MTHVIDNITAADVIALNEARFITHDEARRMIGLAEPKSHLGHPGDQHGLCGAPTLGIPAVNPPSTCDKCQRIWAAMPWWRQENWKRANAVLDDQVKP